MAGTVEGAGKRDDAAAQAAQKAAAERAAQQAAAQRAAQQAQQLGNQLKTTGQGVGGETSKVGVATNAGGSSMQRTQTPTAVQLNAPQPQDRPRPSAPNARPSFPTPGMSTPRAPAPKPADPPKAAEPPATLARNATGGRTDTGFQAQANLSLNANVGPVSVAAKANVSAEVSRTTENGVTTLQLDTKASLTVSGQLDAKGASLEASRTDSLTGRVQVQVPQGQEAALGDVRNLNPLDPSKLPTGTKVTIDGARNTDTQLNGTFRGLAVETSTGRTDATTLQVEKLEGDRVRVTAGPSEAMRQGFGVGVQQGDSSAMARAAQSLSNEKLKTAEFDLGTQQGRDAYQQFVRSGQFPTQEGPGVSNVSTTEKVKYNHEVSGELQVAGKSLLSGSQQTSAELTRTTKPDGSFTLTGNLNPAGNVPLTATASFDPQGKEVPGSREYSYSLPPMSRDQAQRLAQATNPPGSPAPSREQLNELMRGGATIKLNAEQMQAFRDQAVEAARGDPSFQHGLAQSPAASWAKGMVPRSAESFATQLSMGHGAGRANTEAFVSTLFTVNQRTGRPIGMTVTPGQ